MGRRKKQSGFEALAALPWPLGLVAGIVGYLGVRYGIGWWFSHHGGMLSQGFAQQSSGAFAPLAWMLLGICWLAALCSYLGSRSRQRFLDTRTTLESLAAGGWRQFERLVGEAFRRQGYSVEETGLGGADGGIDLILRKDGRRTLVQCKQWKRQQVGVSVARNVRPAGTSPGPRGQDRLHRHLHERRRALCRRQTDRINWRRTVAEHDPSGAATSHSAADGDIRAHRACLWFT